MIEAIQAAGVQAATQAAPATAQAAQPQASGFQVHQFSEAYARGGAGAPEATAAQAPQGPSNGMRALAAFADNLNGGANNVEAIAQKMTGANFASNPSAMLEMTMACHEFMFKAQLTSNVANRTSDGVQQLFRQQS